MSAPDQARLHVPLPRYGYLPGEVVDVEMLGIDASPIEPPRRFTILSSPGSGFAGQVYRAESAGGSAGEVAIKVLRPRSWWKEFFRDELFWLCFQSAFAPRLREEAVRCGLLWQEILRAAAEETLGPGAVARPLGYFWDARIASYAEVHEWVESRPPRYEPDDLLVARWLGKTREPAQTEMARKQRFMERLAALCHAVGAMGLARQYAWYTLISQANVVSRPEPGGTLSPFAAVDCRVGLAFPFFLPFTPAHLRIALEGLRRGVLVHYDEADFSRLDGYLAERPALAERLKPLVGCLMQSNARYRERLPDLWHTRARLLVDPAFRARVREAAVEDWERMGIAGPENAALIRQRPWLFTLLCLLVFLPALGSWIARLIAHPGYRAHARAILAQPAYRKLWLDQIRARDLAAWQAEGRLSSRRAQRLDHSSAAFIFEKAAMGWLPGGFHRLLTDSETRRQVLESGIIRPLRLLVSQSERIAWLEGIVQAQRARGLIRPDRAAILLQQIREPHMAGFARDLGFIAGLDIIARLVYLGLGIYGISTRDFLPLGLAALGPVPPSGPLRLLYVLGLIAGDLVAIATGQAGFTRQLVLARLGALLASPWRGIGNLFPVLEISAYYPRLALLLADHYASQAVGWIPVFGGRGNLLEYWVFELIYNVPVGFRKIIKGEG